MKKFLTALVATTFCIPVLSAQNTSDDAQAKAKAEKEAKKPKWVREVNALPDEKRDNYWKSFRRCDELFNQKRVFECLAEIHKLQEIYNKNPTIFNLKGACYVEFRAFNKAEKVFGKALAASPDDFNILFNIAEIKFVRKIYDQALPDLEALEKRALDEPKFQNMLPLVQFKIVLCKLKLDDLAGAKAIVEKTDFLGDSPLYYYGNAAFEYRESQLLEAKAKAAKESGNEKEEIEFTKQAQSKSTEAEVWLARARRIFKNNQLIAPWQDTLIEFGYIKSFYGGDLAVEDE